MKLLQLGILALAALLAFPASGQKAPLTSTEAKIFIEKLKADKKVIVAKNMQLTEAYAKDFWPVYDAYQKDLEALNKRLGTMVVTFTEAHSKGPVPDAIAKKILEESIAIDEDELKAKRAMVAKLDKVLPGGLVARYVQIENKIRAMIRMELADALPLAD